MDAVPTSATVKVTGMARRRAGSRSIMRVPAWWSIRPTTMKRPDLKQA